MNSDQSAFANQFIPKTNYLRKYCFTFLVILSLSFTLSAQNNCSPADKFLNQTFKTYNIIGLDEGPHATKQIHSYLRKLIVSKNVSQVIDYIILEFLSTTYQGVINDYISGKNVSTEQLREAWRNGTQSHSTKYGEAPVYIELLNTIRLSNKSNTHKIKVLGGDPGIDWSKVTNQREFFRCLSQRDLFPAHLAIEFGINQNKKILMIYGGAHFGKFVDEKSDSSYWTIDYIINNRFPNSIYTIGIINSARKYNITINSICNSSMAISAEFKDSIQAGNGQLYPMLKIYDAMYYLGTNEKWEADDAKSIDIKYWYELDRRSKIVWGAGLDTIYRKND